MSGIELGNRLVTGRQLERAGRREKEKDALGTLRGGNSGIMDEQGNIAGSCHRAAHLRSLGLEVEEPGDSTMIMFQMGTANEDVVYRDLLQTSSPDEIILREEEIPTYWETSNGTPVTGRPDMVVCRRAQAGEPGARAYTLSDGSGAGWAVPLWGIEIKSVASVYTSLEVLFGGSPKLAHLIQAAHYSWNLGKIPFRLLYKQYVNQVVPGWATSKFPRQGAPLSEYIEYNEKGDIKYVAPYEIVYELDWNSAGYLRFRIEGSNDEWTRTIIRAEDIQRFYEFVSRMAETKDLGSRPLNLDYSGKEKSWSFYKYSPIDKIHRAVDNRRRGVSQLDYDGFIQAVRDYIAERDAAGGSNRK